jgi:hypothetical protein
MAVFREPHSLPICFWPPPLKVYAPFNLLSGNQPFNDIIHTDIMSYDDYKDESTL